MNLQIEAPGHPNQSRLQEYYQEQLSNMFGKYQFIHSVSAYVQSLEHGRWMVGLKIAGTKGASFYSKDSSQNEGKAFRGAIKKLYAQIERHKRAHYSSFQRRKRFTN